WIRDRAQPKLLLGRSELLQSCGGEGEHAFIVRHFGNRKRSNMNELDRFAMAALHGTASSALESNFLAQRAYDIARACLRISKKLKKTDAHTEKRKHGSNLPVIDTTKSRKSKCGKYTIPSDFE